MAHADEPASAVVVHTLPGRTRLRIPDRQRDAVYFSEMARRLSEHPQVKRVAVNPDTASILIEHDGTIDAIAAEFTDKLRLVLHATPARSVAVRPPQFSPAALLQLFALACILLSAYQLRRGRLIGAATENWWNAFNAWRKMKEPGTAIALLAAGLVQLARGQVLSPAVSLVFYALNLRRMSAATGPRRP